MRWHYHDRRPAPYDLKIRTRFLFLPKYMNGQFRWLEIAKIAKQFQDRDNDGSSPWVWTTVGFADELATAKMEGKLGRRYPHPWTRDDPWWAQIFFADIDASEPRWVIIGILFAFEFLLPLLIYLKHIGSLG